MIKKIYIYLVLFATLMMSIGGGVSIFMNLADLLSPPAYYQSFEEYKMMVKDRELSISESEMLQQYNQMKEEYQKREKTRAQNGLIKSLGWIIIPLPIFIIFQRKLVRSEA